MANKIKYQIIFFSRGLNLIKNQAILFHGGSNRMNDKLFSFAEAIK